MSESRMRRMRALLSIGCCLAYFSIAIYAVTMGAAASTMMQHWQIDAAKQGLILTVQSVGGILLSVLILFVGNRLNKMRALIAGLAVMLAGYVLMAWLPGVRSTYGVLLAIAAPVGVGSTAIDVMVNGVVVDAYGEKSATVLPFAHATYSVGATLAPVIASLLIDPVQPATYGRAFLSGSVICLVALVVVTVASREISRGGGLQSNASAQKENAPGGTILKQPRAWLYLICGLFYFCFSWGVATWLPSYCESVEGFSYRLSNLAASGFFLGALVMRFLSPLLFARLSYRRVFLLTSFLSGLCMLIAVLVPVPGVILPMVILSGFMQGALVICLVMLCCAAFPYDTAGASSLAVLAGTLGMLIAPVVMGLFSGRSSFRMSMYFAVGCMFVSFLLASVTTKEQPGKNG